MSDNLMRAVHYVKCCAWAVLLFSTGMILITVKPTIVLLETSQKSDPVKPAHQKNDFWVPPDSASIPNTEEGRLIAYGRDLVARTAAYLGPHGKVKPLTNGMNCQNCHLKAGTLPYGNNYSGVAANYPKFRARSGTVESVEKRVNDCIERSLNGEKLEDNSKEMKGFVAYLMWIGRGVPKKKSPKGAGLLAVPILDRPADPKRGEGVFKLQCSRCHGDQGQGMKLDNGIEWKYPPLWGEQSYNVGAGLFRLSRFAGYVKANMPNDLASYSKPVLKDEEAWDVAAYVNSMPRPSKDISADWPDISKKPFDHPFGPYADRFSEVEHKYGPFASIQKAQKKER